MAKLTLLEKLFVTGLAVVFTGIVLHAPLSVALGTVFPDFTLVIKSWKEIVMIALAIIAGVLVTRKKMWQVLGKDRLFWVILTYACLHILLIPLHFEGSTATLTGLAIDLRYILFFSLVYIAVLLYPASRRLFVPLATVGAFIVAGFATLQLFLPPDILSHIGYNINTIQPYLTVDKNPDYVRVNSTLRGPNPLGAYVVIVLAGLTAFAVRARLKLQANKETILYIVLTVCSLIALWISYSRSALGGAAVAILVVLAVTVLRRVSRTVWIGSVMALFMLAGGLVANRDSTFISNVLFHENPQGGSAVSSNDGHVESLAEGFDRMIHQPFGGGIGSTGSASLEGDSPLIIENQYLFVAHEAGWIGLLLFLYIFFAVLYRAWQRRTDWLALAVFASGIGLALIGLLQPVWADDTVSIIWWGLAAIAIVGGKNERKTSKQKTA